MIAYLLPTPAEIGQSVSIDSAIAQSPLDEYGIAVFSSEQQRSHDGQLHAIAIGNAGEAHATVSCVFQPHVMLNGGDLIYQTQKSESARRRLSQIIDGRAFRFWNFDVREAVGDAQ